jgi:serine/threonine protein kinase
MNSNQKIVDLFNKIVSNRGPKVLCRPLKLNNLENHKKLGKGEYGMVFRGLIKSLKKYVVYKIMDYEKFILKNRKGKPSYTTDDLARVEYNISKKLREGGITCVPKVYKITTCDKEGNTNDKKPNTILYSEFIKGRDLLHTTPKNMREYVSILVQTIYNLYKIHDEFPSFRHHDLHLGNIMIKEVEQGNIEIKIPSTYKVPKNSLFSQKTEEVNFKLNNAGLEVVIIDFGLSHLPEAGITNPLVDFETHKKSHGIFKNSDQCYDLYLFLISLYQFASRESKVKTSTLRAGYGKKIIEFIEKALPDDFFSENLLRESRLRYNARTTKEIPNYTVLLNMIHNHFGGVFKSSNGQRVLNSIAQSVQRRKTQTKNPTPSNAKKSQSTQNNTSTRKQAEIQERARQVMAGLITGGRMGTGRQFRPAASRQQRQPTNRPPTAAKTSQSIARSPTAAKTSRTTVTLRNPVLERVKTSNIPASSRATPSRNQKNKNTGGAVKSTNPSSSVNNRTPSTMVHSTKKNRKTNRRSNNSSN